MTEGRTSAAEANVEAEDRPDDAPTSTGTAGAGDVTGSAGTNGHESTANGTTSGGDADSSSGSSESDSSESASSKSASSKSASSESDSSDTAAETVPAATLPGEDSDAAPAHGAAATDSAKTDESKADTAKAGDTKADTAKADSAADAKADSATDGDEDWADAEDKAYKKELRKGFAFGAAGGILVGAIVALLLGAFVWPGYLMGPGSPDDTATQVTQALSAKDSAKLDQLSCKGPDGKPVSQLSGQVLQYIAKVAPAGPATTVIDTEARAPVDVTLSVQGQTQTLPSELVLGESKGDWCLKGLAQRQ